MTIRIATFNVENLFTRFDFSGRAQRERRLVGHFAFDDLRQFEMARMIFAAINSDDMRQLTALALAETHADIVCLQEVDNQDALDVFYENYVRRVLLQGFASATKHLPLDERRAVSPDYFYDFRRVLPGNDRRGINVAVMSRRDVSIRSHADLTYSFLHDQHLDWENLARVGEEPDKKIFRRDCLEIDAFVDGAPLTIYVCHLKSREAYTPKGDPGQETRPVRQAETMALRRIIERRFGHGVRTANWMICGDLNDFYEIDGEPVHDHALSPLLDGGFAINPMERRPPQDRWTHYHTATDAHVQLDYILLSPALAAANPNAIPEIVRKGQAYRVPRLTGTDRYPRIGWDRPKASDHCPVAIEVHVPKH